MSAVKNMSKLSMKGKYFHNVVGNSLYEFGTDLWKNAIITMSIFDSFEAGDSIVACCDKIEEVMILYGMNCE